MIRNYLTIALRNLWKRRAQTLINVLGLSLGVASAIVIFLIVRYELSFDRFHEKADRVYRIVTDFQGPDGEFGNAGVPRPLPNALQQDFPDAFTQIVPVEVYQDRRQVQIEDKTVFMDEMVAFTQSAYFKLFDFPFQEGNATTVLNQPNEVVITATLSQKLFGRSSEVLGEIINLNDTYDLEVVGVLHDLPESTDLSFDMLVSFNTLSRNRDVDREWDSFNSAFQTYVLLNQKVSAESVQAQLTTYLNKYIPDSDGYDSYLHLQPLLSIHFEGKYGGEPHHKTAWQLLVALTVLGTLLVLLACINFVNLATAVSTRRSKEIGVRKVVGSSRKQIILYFLGEALLITVLATALALGLAEIGLIQLQQLFGSLQNIDLNIDFSLLLFLLVLILGVSLLAGSYPALLLSRFRPIQMFNPYLHTPKRNRLTVRHTLVVFQFFIVQLFIISVLVVGQQLRYLTETPLGFDRDAILTLNFPDANPQKQLRFQQTLQTHSGVEVQSLSKATAISQSMYATLFGYDGQSQEESQRSVNLQFADTAYFSTYQIQLLAGEIYSPSDSGSGFIVNEAFLREVGATTPEEVLGNYVTIEVDQPLELPIVGVVADYHTNTFGRKIPPLLITNIRSQYRHLNLKVNMPQAEEVIGELQSLWLDNYPDFPFKYRFLDDAIAGFYEEYRRQLSLTQLFSSIAIAIGCLGLYGLVLFMAEQRTKEIGIRKVLGASVKQLLTLFSGEFIKLVLIAFCLAAPIAYFLMQKWLENFVYRIDIGITVFIGCLLVTLLLVIATVGYRSTRAALANPVDSLRNE